jgi:hypothetical protein
MRIGFSLVAGLALLPSGLSAAPAATAATKVTVNCDAGQTISRALSKLDKAGPNVVKVHGTCQENVVVKHFDDLRIVGAPGATILGDPATPGVSVLQVLASRSVTIDGLTVSGPGPSGFEIESCVDCRIQNCWVSDAVIGIGIWANADVTVSRCRVSHVGAAGMGVAEASANITGSEFDGGPSAWAGIFVRAGGVANLADSVVRNFSFGADVGDGACLSIGNPSPPGSSVTIQDNTCTGLSVGRNGQISVGETHLRVARNGSVCTGAGINVDTGAIFNAGPQNSFLEVVDNMGSGISLNHHALLTLGTGRISGNAFSGVDVRNDSMAIGPLGWTTQTFEISGNGNDIYCDSTSMVTNAARITGATQVACPNVKQEDFQ